MPDKISWKQNFINNLIWFIIFNVANVWIGRPMYTGENMTGLRTALYFISGFIFFFSWINVTKILAQKKGWFIAILISLPTSLIINFIIIQLF